MFKDTVKVEIKVWERMYSNLYAFLHYLFLEKCYKKRTEKGKPLTCVLEEKEFEG